MQDQPIQESPDPIEQQTPVLAEISREMVRLYKEQFGRGPTKARSFFAGPDTVICTLEHSLTPVESKLVQLGEHQRLRDVRLYFQHATEAEFREVIERLLTARCGPSSAGWTSRSTSPTRSSTWFHWIPGLDRWT